MLTYSVVARHPHLTTSYTEGLFYRGGHLYEGTGIEGRSKLLEMDPATGQLLKSVSLSPQYFGEGISRLGAVHLPVDLEIGHLLCV
ncbi:MAG: glutaminyl-peptide cyclotransferase [Acidobacteriales bacterium]|nr:glutaminyl-peptide cyclotransferase [Terriglobales bacterium]